MIYGAVFLEHAEQIEQHAFPFFNTFARIARFFENTLYMRKFIVVVYYVLSIQDTKPVNRILLNQTCL